MLVAKSRRLEVRQLRSPGAGGEGLSSPFPVVLQVPINGRITNLEHFSIPSMDTSLAFLLTDRFRYAAISYNPTLTPCSPYPLQTHASGSLSGEHQNLLGRPADSGPLVAVDQHFRCIALHLYEGLISILPIHRNYTPPHTQKTDGDRNNNNRQQQQPNHPPVLGPAFHCRIEERTVLAMTFLWTTTTSGNDTMPTLCLLHQGARGEQHLSSCAINLSSRQLHLPGSSPTNTTTTTTTQFIQKSMVDGGSALLIPVPPTTTRLAAAAAASATTPESTTTTTTTTPASGATTTAATCGGVLCIGQQQWTYCSPTTTKILPVRQALFLTADELPADPTGMPRYLLGDEFGNLHMLTVNKNDDVAVSSGSGNNNHHYHHTTPTTAATTTRVVVNLQRDTLGSCTLAASLQYLEQGLVFCGSALGDSQLVQIHDEPIPLQQQQQQQQQQASSSTSSRNNNNAVVVHDVDSPTATAGGEDGMVGGELMETTYLSVVEEYTQLGPILDFDLIPTTLGGGDAGSGQSQVLTASGSSKSGSLRLIRNGIGMNESAAVEIPGIQNMWSVRKSFGATDDTYLVQSFVGETRVLGVAVAEEEDMLDEEDDEVGGTLEEVDLPGLDSAASSLHVCNVQEGDRLLQITEAEVRLFAHGTGEVLDAWPGQITVASANEAGQIAVSLQGGTLVYLSIQSDKIVHIAQVQTDREVSCINLHPLVPKNEANAMDTDDGKQRVAHRSELMAVGLWDDFTVRLFNLDTSLDEALCIHLSTEEDSEADTSVDGASSRRSRNNMMARSLSLVTLDLASASSNAGSSSSGSVVNQGVDMLFVGLGDGTLISFAVVKNKGVVSVHSKKEVCLGTQRVDLVPLTTERGGTCVLATGDRPTVVYLAGLGGTSSNQSNPKLCYSNVNLAAGSDEEGDDVSRPPSQQSIAVNVASPFFSPLLFDASSLGSQHYSLCVADDANLRLGVIDDIQKLHVTTCRLGMAPRRVVHCPDGRFFAVGCLESGIKHFGLSDDEANMGNCIRFMDDTTFDDLEQIDLEPFEIILSMVYATLKVVSSTAEASAERPYLLVGTAYALSNEDEPTRGRILVYTCQTDSSNNTRAVQQVTELSTNGGVYSICQFYDGLVLSTVNSKTMICQMVKDAGMMRLEFVGRGHHGNILSLFVKSRARRSALGGGQTTDQSMAMDVAEDAPMKSQQKVESSQEEEKLAIVGDLMRSISLVQYYPEHKTLEEIARDFNGNWTTAIEMLHKNVYLGAENWNNLFCLRRNTASSSEEIRCRLDTIGEFHLGEMCNKFMSGSLVMPVSTSSSNNSKASSSRNSLSHGGGSGSRVRSPSPQKKKSSNESSSPSSKAAASTRMRRPVVVTGSQTLFGTVDGTLGVILGLDGKTTVFFGCLERAMAKVIRPVGDFDHALFRAIQTERRIHPAHGFVDGDLCESFLDLDHPTMLSVVREMNRDGGWQVGDDDDLLLIRGSDVKDTEDRAESGALERAELSVDEVVAMVEEMTMLH